MFGKCLEAKVKLQKKMRTYLRMLTSPPETDQEQRRERQRLWPPNPIRISTFAINSQFSVVGSTQSGKRILSSRFWNTAVSCLSIIRIYGTAIDGKNATKSWKCLGKKMTFERRLLDMSENLCQINTRYNNIIILDVLMAEATDSPVVS